MIATNLSQLRTQVQDQHRLLNKLNEELIRILLHYGQINNWEEVISPGRSVRHAIDYLRMIRTKALTVENFRLMSIATDLACLQDVSIELDNEISCHRELQQLLRDRSGPGIVRKKSDD
jgi:hypothetical protein